MKAFALLGCLLASLITASLLIPTPTNAVDVYTDPVGFITLTAQGTNGLSAASTSTYVGLGMTRLVEYQGKISSTSSNAFADTNATWTDNQFNGPAGAYFVEFTSGTSVGLMDDIVATVASTKTIYTANPIASYLAGNENYRIRKHWTISSVFGPNNEVGLKGGTSTTADLITVLNPITQVPIDYYYSTGGLAGVGWRRAGGGSTDTSNTILYVDQGFLIRRKAGVTLAIKLPGAVKLGTTMATIETGKNFMSNVYAYQGANLTLNNSNLYNNGGNSTTSLVGGTSTSADQLIFIDPSTQVPSTFYYSTGGLAGTGWRKAGSGSTDFGGFQFPLGQSALVIRKAGRPAFNWVLSAPY